MLNCDNFLKKDVKRCKKMSQVLSQRHLLVAECYAKGINIHAVV